MARIRIIKFLPSCLCSRFADYEEDSFLYTRHLHALSYRYAHIDMSCALTHWQAIDGVDILVYGQCGDPFLHVKHRQLPG